MNSMKQELKTENRTFRYLYGLAILFVVLSHCDGGGFEMLSNWMHFGAFHLAIFVFGSGYFLKSDAMNNPFKYLGKKVCKLLLPLWGLHFLYGIIVWILHYIGFTFGDAISLKSLLLYPISSKDLYVLNMGAWFVFPFFMVQVIYAFGKMLLDLLKKEQITDLIWQIVLLVAGIVCIKLACSGYQQEGMTVLFRIAYFMPFYILGIWYHNYFETLMERINASLILGACLCVALLINAHIGRVVYAIPSSCDYPFGVVATYLSALVGVVFWLTVSRELDKGNFEIKLLKIIGSHTWDIMFHQFAGILLVKVLFSMGNKLFGTFQDFDYVAYYNDIWYLYLPKGIPEFKALYVVGAIGFSVIAGYFIGLLKNKTVELCKLKEKSE